MWEQLRNYFAPPVFPDDAEKTRIARLLNIILLVVIALVLLFTVPAVVMTPELDRILVELVLIGVAIGMLLLMRRGYIRQTGYIICTVLLVGVTVGTYQAGGFSGSTMSAYFGIIIIAGMLLGHGSAILFGVLSIIFTGYMVYADAQGFIPAAPAYANYVTFWIEFSTVVVGVIGLVSLVMTSLQRALEQLRQDERALAAKVIEAEQATQAALEASNFKTRLIARVSHELRTPLGIIMGMAEMLFMGTYGEINEEQRETLQRLIANSQYLERSFNELLEQAQIDMGQILLKEEHVNIPELVLGVELSFRREAERKGLLLTSNIEPDFPKTLWCDPRRVEQILINLIGNAIKFTPVGSVQISVAQNGPKHWCLQVADTGLGVSKEAQEYIFEPFRQVDESIAREYGGVGLGLSIVKQLTDAMGGKIALESKEKVGSTFTIILPLKLGPAKEDASAGA